MGSANIMEPEIALKQIFGHERFRTELQEKAVLCALKGDKDLLIMLPTGYGKSLCYQLPAVCSSKTTIVVSPLLALIEDQVSFLQKLGIRAAQLSSRTRRAEAEQIIRDFTANPPALRLLYITPEKAASANFRKLLKSRHQNSALNCLAIDEAHCISEWGHDFRPDYLKLGEIRTLVPGLPIIALTATATERVQTDIIKNLKLRKNDLVKIKAPVFRENLFYDIQFKELLGADADCEADLIEFMRDHIHAKSEASTYYEDSGIVYCRTRDECHRIAGILSLAGIKAKAYCRISKIGLLNF